MSETDPPARTPDGPVDAELDPGEEKGRPSVSREAVRWGIGLFVIGSVVGFGALFFITEEPGDSLLAFQQFRPLWAIPSLLFASLDWFGGGVRVWLLLRPLDIRLSYWECVKISGATAGMAYLTPSGMGGGPAHLYGVVRQNVDVGPAVATNFASFLVNITFLTAAGVGAWFFGAAGTIEEITLPVVNLSAARLFEWTVWGFAGALALVFLFAANPRIGRRAIVDVFGSGRRVRTFLTWINDLHESLLLYARKGKLALLLATLSGALHFGGRFLLGWSVLRGFGIDAGFWNIVILHVMLQFLLIFMPTPGGTGVGEILTPALMRPFMPTSLLVAYTAVWRFFLTYLTVVAAGGLLVRWASVDQKRIAESG